MPVLARIAAAALLVGVVAVAYGGSLENGFVFDDAMFVRDDPRLRSLGEAPRLFVEPLWGYMDEQGVAHLHQYYRPLQTFPLALLRSRFGEAAWPAHLLSVALHGANAVLVWSILGTLLGTPWIALALALLYAVHPGYSEAVLWVSNLAGLGAAFCILALSRLHMSAFGLRWSVLPLATVLFFCGLLFHEIAVVAPLLMIAYDAVAARPRRWRGVAMTCAAFVPALLLYLRLRTQALGGLVPGLGVNALDPWQLAINAVGLLPQFVAAFVWPFELNMYHDFTPLDGWRNETFAAGAGLLAIAALGFVLALRRRPLVAFAIAWTALTITPYLIVRWPQLNVFAERYLYLPAVGVFLLAGVLLRGKEGRGGLRAWGLGIAVAIAVTIGVRTIWMRIPDWRDDVTLYSKTLTQSERAVLIRNNLSVRLLEQERYAEGIEVLEKVVELRLSTPQTWHNLGLLRAGAGDDGGALAAFREAGRHGQVKWPTLLNLGYMYDRVGERRRAVETYMRLLDRAPDYAPAWFNLGAIAFETGQFDNARKAIAEVLRHSPDDADARLLDVRLRRLAVLKRPSLQADRDATQRSCKQAMKQAERGRYREATILLRAAAWLDERAPRPHQYLANVAALRGDWELALAEERAALERAPHSKLYRRNVEALEKKLQGDTKHE